MQQTLKALLSLSGALNPVLIMPAAMLAAVCPPDGVPSAEHLALGRSCNLQVGGGDRRANDGARQAGDEEDEHVVGALRRMVVSQSNQGKWFILYKNTLSA